MVIFIFTISQNMLKYLQGKKFMKNICLLLEYLGKNYSGYQKQINAVSIQQVLEDAIFEALGERVDTFASGRTDAKVNALGQVVNFFTSSRIAPEKMAICINRHLPQDIRVISSREVPEDFNSRLSAKSKTYEYRLVYKRPLSVFEIDRAVSYSYTLDFELLKRVLKKFEGEHDFSSFMASGSNIKDKTIRTIYSFTFERSGDNVTFTIRGNGFLYNMVRILIGTSLDIARGVLDYSVIDKLLEGKNRKLAGKTAPAEGLYLKCVEY